MDKRHRTADISLSALAILIPPALLAGGQLAWSWASPEPAAAQTLAAPAAASLQPAVSLVDAQAGVAGPVHVSARLDRSGVLQGGDGLVHVELTLRADEAEGASSRVPTDLVVVLDRSGSMAGDKIEDARAATRSIIGALTPQDRFALVTYDDMAELTVPLGIASEENRRRWLSQVERVDDRGSTNISGGLDLGLATLAEPALGRAQRLILISDGLPNAGDPSPEGLASRARKAAAHESPLTAVGVGEDFNEELMRALADAGTGNYYYVQETDGLAEVFQAELGYTGQTVATGLAVTVKPGDGVLLVDAAGFPFEATATGALFRVGSLRAGQTRQLWLTYRVDAATAGQTRDLGALGVRFQADGQTLAAAVPTDLNVAVLDDPQEALAAIDQDAWTEAVLTEEYNALRTRVASAVKAGDQASARADIAAYRARNEAVNMAVGSAAVSENLSDLSGLEAQVTDAFQGHGQAEKQNLFSKSTSASSYIGRRKGQMER